MTSNPAKGGGTGVAASTIVSPAIGLATSAAGNVQQSRASNLSASSEVHPPGQLQVAQLRPQPEINNRTELFYCPLASHLTFGVLGASGVTSGIALAILSVLKLVPPSVEIAAVAIASLFLLPVAIAVVELRRVHIIDRVALTIVAAATILTVGAGWLWLATSKQLAPIAPVSAPLLVVGAVAFTLFMVARTTRAVAGVFTSATAEEASRAPYTLLGDRSNVIDHVAQIAKGSEIDLKSGFIAPADIELVSGTITVDERFLSGVSTVRVLDEGDVVFGGSRILAGEAKGRALSGSNDSCLALLEAVLSKRLSRAILEARMEETTARRSTLLALIFCAVAAAISFSERSIDPTASMLASGSVLLCALFAVLRDTLLLHRLQFLATWSKRGIVVPSLDLMESVAARREVVFEFPVVDAYAQPQVDSLQIIDDRVGLNELAASLLPLLGRAESRIFKSAAQMCRELATDFYPQRVLDFKEFPDEGVSGQLHGVGFNVGTEAFLVSKGIHFHPADIDADTGAENCGLYVSVGADVVALFLLKQGALSGVLTGGPLKNWPTAVSARVYTGTPTETASAVPQLVVRSAAVKATASVAHVTVADLETPPSEGAALTASPMASNAIEIPRGQITLLGGDPSHLGGYIVEVRHHLRWVGRIEQALQGICILGVITTFLGALLPVLVAIGFPLSVLVIPRGASSKR